MEKWASEFDCVVPFVFKEMQINNKNWKFAFPLHRCVKRCANVFMKNQLWKWILYYSSRKHFKTVEFEEYLKFIYVISTPFAPSTLLYAMQEEHVWGWKAFSFYDNASSLHLQLWRGLNGETWMGKLAFNDINENK